MRGQNRQVNAADLRRACLWKQKTLPGFVEGEEASMFGIGSTELLVILVVALIVLGPKSLASVSRTLGKAMGEFRRVSTDFQRTLNAESAEADIREKAAEQRRKAAAEGAAGNSPAESAPATAGAPDASPAAAAPDTENALTPPEGSPLAEALARARAEAGDAPSTANDARPTADAAMTAAEPAPTPPPAAPSAPDSPTPPVDGPRA